MSRRPRVVLVSPSSAISGFPRRTARALGALSHRGWEPELSPLALWPADAPPAADALADDLTWALSESGADLVMATTGGLTSASLLPHLDYDAIARARTPLCGFSDITALLAGVHAVTGLAVLHGPTLLPSFGDVGGVDQYAWTALRSVMAGRVGLVPASPRTSSEMLSWEDEDDRPRTYEAASPWRAVVHGRGVGPLVGGHLGTLSALVGTPFLPPTAGRLLFLECSGAHPDDHVAEIERLSVAGVFQGVAGLLVGRFPQPDGGQRVVSTLLAQLPPTVPVVADVDLGHTVPLTTVPIGVRAEVTAGRSGCGLRVLEPAVRDGRAVRYGPHRASEIPRMSRGTPASRTL